MTNAEVNTNFLCDQLLHAKMLCLTAYLLSSLGIFVLCSVHLGLCDMYFLFDPLNVSLFNCSI